MRSVAIATLIDSYNYGNRLQNFALQEALSGLGFDQVHTISAKYGTHHGYGPVLSGYHLLRSQGSLVVKAGIHRLKGGPPQAANESALAEFSRTHVHLAGTGYVDRSNPGVDCDSYDYFVVGSDQVWNPVFGLPYGLDFLQFARKNQRVSYAPSFGVDTVPARLRSRYRNGLRGIPRLSVREGHGQAIIKRLTGRDAVRVVDPTLLHGEEFWRSFARAAGRAGRSEYAVVGALATGASPALRSAVDRARAEGLRIVNLLAEPGIAAAGGRSPEEFLNLISGASMVVTDSFHVSLFALRFGTPLQVVGRSGMRSRLATLFELVGLAEPRPPLDGELRVISIDPDQARDSLDAARVRSLEYLAGSFA